MYLKESSIVGDLINFRGLVYSPINENGVIFLFGKVAEDLNMYVEEIKAGFPDCIARRFTGKGWERVAIEFEFNSKNFLLHGHDHNKCDIIVCWEHDWSDCPIEVIELKERIKEFVNAPVKRPNESTSKEEFQIEKTIEKLSTKMSYLLKELDSRIKSISEDIWTKRIKDGLTYYSPERVFIYVSFQKSGLKLTLFTKGNDIKGVKRTWEVAGEKWGNTFLKSDKELDEIENIVKESYSLIKEAIKHNEATGWYATIENE